MRLPIATLVLTTVLLGCGGGDQERASSDSVASPDTADNDAGPARNPCGLIDEGQLERMLGGPVSEREVYDPPAIAEYVCAFETDQIGGADIRLLAFDNEEVFDNIDGMNELAGVGERAVEWGGSAGGTESLVITFVVGGNTYAAEFYAASEDRYIDGTERMFFEAMVAELADELAA